jgi:hypothetical protein
VGSNEGIETERGRWEKRSSIAASRT